MNPIEWRLSGDTSRVATVPVSDDRYLSMTVSALGPDASEIIIDLYRGSGFITQILAVRVRLTLGRAQQRAAKLANTLAPVL